LVVSTTAPLDALEALILKPSHVDLVRRVDALVASEILPRVASYDERTEAPVEDIQALHAEGWLLANLAREYGGLGYGLAGDDALAFYLMIEHLAKGSASTAHCFQVHNHTLQMISLLASPGQRARWIQPTRERAALLVGAGAEPVGAGQTQATRVDGGYRVRGTKHFATNATLAEWIWCTAAADDVGGKTIMLMVHKDSPGLTVDASVWHPTGMRACISPTLVLEDCFVREEETFGAPGEWWDGQWLGKLNLGFAANYLGSAQGMYDWQVDYVKARGANTDPFRQAEVGEIKALLDAARLVVYHTALLFRVDQQRALLSSLEAKWITQEVLGKIIKLGGDIAGSTALFQKYPLERYYRDMHVHMTHSRQIVSAQVLGASELGAEYNINRQR
jgi:alkylation response protein AidB-like acyl-CoA dehydrogenase